MEISIPHWKTECLKNACADFAFYRVAYIIFLREASQYYLFYDRMN